MPRRRYKARGLKVKLRRVTRIEGIEELERGLQNIADATTGQAAVEILVDAGRVAKKEIYNRAPLGPTGNLRRSIFLDARDPFHDPKGPSVLVGVNHNIAPHWHFLELGTVKQRARPFIRPGMIAAAPQMERIITTGLRDLIEGAGE